MSLDSISIYHTCTLQSNQSNLLDQVRLFPKQRNKGKQTRTNKERVERSLERHPKIQYALKSKNVASNSQREHLCNIIKFVCFITT